MSRSLFTRLTTIAPLTTISPLTTIALTATIALAATIALVATAVACSGGRSGPVAPAGPTVHPPPSAPAGTAPTGDGGHVVARIRVGGQPCGVLATASRVWVSNYGDGTVRWVDVATNQPGPPIRVGTRPCGLALGAGSVWVENYGSDDVTRVDAATGQVIATIGVGGRPYDVTFAFGAAWVTDYGSATVSRIDAADNSRSAIHTGGQPTGIVAAGGALWVGLGGEAARIDPGTRAVTHRVRAGAGAGWTAATADQLWVSNGRDNTVTHIDARSAAVVATVPVGGQPLDGDVTAGAVWIPTRVGDLYAIDPATHAVRGPYRTGAAFPFVVAGYGDTLWVADYGGTDLLRLDLTRLD